MSSRVFAWFVTVASFLAVSVLAACSVTSPADASSSALSPESSPATSCDAKARSMTARGLAAFLVCTTTDGEASNRHIVKFFNVDASFNNGRAVLEEVCAIHGESALLAQYAVSIEETPSTWRVGTSDLRVNDGARYVSGGDSPFYPVELGALDAGYRYGTLRVGAITRPVVCGMTE